jgi:hypothetical protein
MGVFATGNGKKLGPAFSKSAQMKPQDIQMTDNSQMEKSRKYVDS